MNKLTRAGFILFTVGMILFVGVLATTGWDISRFSINAANRAEYVEKSLVLDNHNQTITISDRDVEIVVQPSDDNKIHIMYFESDKSTYSIDDKLNITMKKVSNGFNWFGISFLDFSMYVPTMTIKLPIDFTGDLELNTSNASIKVEGIVSANATLKTSNNKVSISDSKIDSLNAQSSNGMIEISNSASDKVMDVTTSNGKIAFESIHVGELMVQTSNANVVLDRVSVDNNSTISSSNGNIHAKQINTTGNLKMETSNGGIDMTIIGKPSQFSIVTKTSNGSSNLNDSNEGSQSLNLKTSNGNIKVDFID